MDEDSLAATFFAWTEANERHVTCNVMFESAHKNRLRFHLDKALVTIDFEDSVCTVSGGKKAHDAWKVWCQPFLLDHSGDILTGELPIDKLLTKLIQKYESIKGSGENGEEEGEELDLDEGDFGDDFDDDEGDEPEPADRNMEETKVSQPEEIVVSPELESKLQRLENAFAGRGSTSANKRILNEYKYLVTSKECVGISVEFENGDNMYTWLASLDMDRFEVPKELKNDFKVFAERTRKPRHLVFEVRFDANFPFSPPFLRVVRPRFAFHTGHITVGGSVCMQSITPSGWIPVRTVESIFIEILFNMGEGGARLDLSQANSDYSLDEARDAFQRVAQAHQWL